MKHLSVCGVCVGGGGGGGVGEVFCLNGRILCVVSVSILSSLSL